MKHFIFSLTILILLGVTAPALALAQSDGGFGGGGFSTGGGFGGETATDVVYLTKDAQTLGESNSGTLSQLFSGNTDLAGFINLLFEFSITIGGILAVVMLTYSGWLYMTSSVADKKAAARQKITNALIGLLMLLATWIILNQINPDILELDFLSGDGTGTNIEQPGGTVTDPVGGDRVFEYPAGSYTYNQIQSVAGEQWLGGSLYCRVETNTYTCYDTIGGCLASEASGFCYRFGGDDVTIHGAGGVAPEELLRETTTADGTRTLTWDPGEIGGGDVCGLTSQYQNNRIVCNAQTAFDAACLADGGQVRPLRQGEFGAFYAHECVLPEPPATLGTESLVPYDSVQEGQHCFGYVGPTTGAPVYSCYENASACTAAAGEFPQLAASGGCFEKEDPTTLRYAASAQYQDFSPSDAGGGTCAWWQTEGNETYALCGFESMTSCAAYFGDTSGIEPVAGTLCGVYGGTGEIAEPRIPLGFETGWLHQSELGVGAWCYRTSGQPANRTTGAAGEYYYCQQSEQLCERVLAGDITNSPAPFDTNTQCQQVTASAVNAFQTATAPNPGTTPTDPDGGPVGLIAPLDELREFAEGVTPFELGEPPAQQTPAQQVPTTPFTPDAPSQEVTPDGSISAGPTSWIARVAQAMRDFADRVSRMVQQIMENIPFIGMTQPPQEIGGDTTPTPQTTTPETQVSPYPFDLSGTGETDADVYALYDRFPQLRCGTPDGNPEDGCLELVGSLFDARNGLPAGHMVLWVPEGERTNTTNASLQAFAETCFEAFGGAINVYPDAAQRMSYAGDVRQSIPYICLPQ